LFQAGCEQGRIQVRDQEEVAKPCFPLTFTRIVLKGRVVQSVGYCIWYWAIDFTSSLSLYSRWRVFGSWFNVRRGGNVVLGGGVLWHRVASRGEREPQPIGGTYRRLSYERDELSSFAIVSPTFTIYNAPAFPVVSYSREQDLGGHWSIPALPAYHATKDREGQQTRSQRV
jgi:hypothetical protein